MADQPVSPDVTPVTNRRPEPRGVLPRRIQTWIMAGLAAGIVLIILVAGHPNAPAPPSTSQATQQQPPATDEVHDYQSRLQSEQARAAQEEARVESLAKPAPAPSADPQTSNGQQDEVAADKRRLAYQSLFASNVVLSRRPAQDQPEPTAITPTATPTTTAMPTTSAAPAAMPSLDEIAEAAARATARVGAAAGAALSAVPPPATTGPSPAQARPTQPQTTGPIESTDPLQRILEGTFIDTILTNRLDGDAAAPVNCLVTNPVYSHDGQEVLIPAGARVLGETRPVQALGQTRLAVAFHRLLMPDGRTYSLDQFTGMNQAGDAGLTDQVNQHYWSTFGAAAAVGLIGGLAQYLGAGGLAGGAGNRTVVIAGDATGGTAQAAMQVMNRFLNRLPTITIREGHRVEVYLTSDLKLPPYSSVSRTF